MSDGTTIVVVTALVQFILGLIAVIVTQRYKERVRGDVERMLNEQRNEFDQITATQQRHHDQHMEQLRLEGQRLTHEFGLFAAKRNEVYAEIYSKFAMTVGRLLSATALIRFRADYGKLSRDEAEEVLAGDSLQMLASRRKEILQRWDTDREGAVKAVEKEEESTRGRRADGAFQEAKNATVIQELYLSTEVDLAIRDLTIACSKVMAHIHWPERHALKEAHQLAEEAESSLHRLRFTMQKEMRRGLVVALAVRPDGGTTSNQGG